MGGIKSQTDKNSKISSLILYWFLTILNPDKKESWTLFSFQKGNQFYKLREWELKIQAGRPVVNLRSPSLLKLGIWSLSAQRQNVASNGVTQVHSDSADHAIRPKVQNLQNKSCESKTTPWKLDSLLRHSALQPHWALTINCLVWYALRKSMFLDILKKKKG